MSRHPQRPRIATLSNRLWLPKELATPEHLSAFTYVIQDRVFDELFGGFVIEDREICAYRERGSKLGFHSGNLEKLQQTFRGFTFLDERSTPRLPLKGRQLKLKLTLRPEQAKAVKAWSKRGYGIIFAPVRWGKTIVAAEAAFRLGLRTIMMVDKISLAQQWLDEIRQHSNLNHLERKLGYKLADVVAGSLKAGGLSKLKELPPLTFTTFQSISSLLRRRKKWMKTQRDRFGLVIVDECFVAGTRILMADGREKPIEQVVGGDFVWTPAGPRMVKNTMLRQGAIFRVVASDGGEVVCTANHPFATKDGFIPGGSLNGYQEVIRCSVQSMPQAHEARQQGGVSPSVPASGLRRWDMPLLSRGGAFSLAWRAFVVLREKSAPPCWSRGSLEQGAFARDRCESGSYGRDERGGAAAVVTGTNDETQPHEGPKSQEQNQSWGEKSHSRRADDSLRESRGVRKRTWLDSIREAVSTSARALGVFLQSAGANSESTHVWISDVLQDRFRATSPQDSCGDRRHESPDAREEVEGQEEDALPRETRMARAALGRYALPQGGVVEGTKCFARAEALGKEAVVYNMEVEDVPMYVANGFLVHNCHHTPAMTYANAISFFTAAHRLGVTGSIKRRDGKHQVMHDIMGPVTGIGTQEQLSCTVSLQFPDVNLNPNSSWGVMINNIADSFPLTDAVVEQVIEDAEHGRFVMVHSERNRHLEDMCRRVRRLAPELRANFIHQKVKVPERKRLVQLMERGKIKVLFVGNVFMEGMTIKRADCIHLFPTTTNPETVKQRVGRVRTAMDGKPRPLVRLWCPGGHKGIFAGRAVHLKYFRERPKDFRVEGGAVQDGSETKRKLAKRERLANRSCGLCGRFVDCRSRKGKRAQSPVCPKFEAHQLSSQRKLAWLVARRELLNEYGRRMIDSFHRQDVRQLSDEQRKILHDIFLDGLNHPRTTKMPAIN